MDAVKSFNGEVCYICLNWATFRGLIFSFFFAALVALRNEAAHLQGKDDGHHQRGNQGGQILQACCPVG